MKWGVLLIVLIFLTSLVLASEKNEINTKFFEESNFVTNSQEVQGYVVIKGNVTGLNVVERIQKNIYVVNIKNTKNRLIEETQNSEGQVRGYEVLGKIKPQTKIKQEIENKAKIFFYSDVKEKEKEEIAKKYGKIISNDLDVIEIELIGDINHLASEETVYFLESVPVFTTFNNNVRSYMKTSQIWNILNLTGEGISIAEWDEGWVGSHVDIGDKLIIGDSGHSIKPHATHVAGIMMGNGTSNPLYKGQAPNVAQLISWEWPNSAIELNNETNISVSTYSAVVSQNSWGYNPNVNPYFGDYTSFSSYYDSIIYGDKSETDDKISIVFSAGNSGSLGYNSTLGPGGTAKNVITVGSIDYDDMEISFYSSLGPTDDGRIKPDIVAIGCGTYDSNKITSTLPSDSYGGLCGTSMAAPVVSGIVALMHEAYNKTNEVDRIPSTDKAILIHTATDLGNVGPDYTYGWGLVDAKKATKTALNANSYIVEGNISTGELLNYSFNLSHTAEKLKVTLVWSDPPATPFANIELATDLGINLTYADGTGYYGWLLDKDNPSELATKATNMGEVDGRNNVEQVEINTPALGEYNITIQGYYVTDGPQEFSLIFYQDIFENETPQVNFTISSPSDGYVTGILIQNMSVTTYDDVSQIINCSLEINGTTNYSMNVDAFITNTTCHLNHTFKVGENITYKVFAQDYNENWGKSEQRDINFTHIPIIHNTQIIYIFNESNVVNITLNVSDEDSDTLTYGINSSLFTQDVNSFNWTTNYADAGTYSILFNVTDGTEVVNQTVTLVVNDKVRLNANASNITSSVELNIYVNGSLNETELSDVNALNLTDAANNTLVTFNWNFSQENISLELDYVAESGTLIVKGLNLSSQNFTKTVYINKSTSTFNYVCVVDAEVDLISSLSSDCSNANETNIPCPGTTGAYTCAVEGNYFKVAGLNHSALKGLTVTASTPNLNGGGGGGGGDGDDTEEVIEVCKEDWICEGFGKCIDEKKTQRCFDGNNCGTTLQQPLLEKECVVEEIVYQTQEEIEPEPEPIVVAVEEKSKLKQFVESIGMWVSNLKKDKIKKEEIEETVENKESNFKVDNLNINEKGQKILLFSIGILAFLIVIIIILKR